MTQKVKKLLTALTCSLFVLFAQVATAAPTTSATIIPKAPNIAAKAYILVDAKTEAVLAEQNQNERLAPASLTKLMTLYITFEQLKKGTIRLQDKVRVSETAWKTGGSRMFLRPGSTPTVNELIQGVIVDSGNDASVALAEFIAGNEAAFVQMMNAEAKSLGMANTHFMDATGLPNPEHYSTAQDLAILAHAIITNFPQDYHYFSQKWFTYNNIKQPNRNRLLWRYQFADGLKTGHTGQAGYCLIASAQKDGMRLISVVLGAPSDEARADDSQTLLTYGFRFFKTEELYKAGQVLANPRTYFGKEKTTPVGLNQSLYATVPVGSLKNIKSTKDIKSPLKAPLTQNQTVGTLTVTLDNKTLASAPIVTLKANPKGGFFGRMGDHISLGFHHFFGSK